MPGADLVNEIDAVSIKWKLSMAMSSNEVKTLNAPMVTMVITTSKEDGTSDSRAVEMTLSAFENLHSKVTEVKTHIEQAKLL